jgi:hypothetical protein
MLQAHRKLYTSVLGIIIALSAYPLIMGMRIVFIQLLQGNIRAEEYARYVIPYTAVCGSIVLTVALFPLIARLKRFSTIAATILGVCLFIGFELYIEKITINTPEAQSALAWQLYSSLGTTAGMKAFERLYDHSFRIHYFLVSFTIILLVVGIVYGYGRMIATGDRRKRTIYRFQTILTVLFLTLCIPANFTCLFREPTGLLSPIYPYLTGSFVIVLAVTLGLYLAGFFVGRNRLLSVGLPATAAILACTFMYYGEYKLLDGVLYRFGYSNLYQRLPYAVVTPIDLMTIILSGIITAGLTTLVRGIDNAYVGKHYKRKGIRARWRF